MMLSWRSMHLDTHSLESLKAVSKVDITEDMDVEDVLKLALKNMG